MRSEINTYGIPNHLPPEPPSEQPDPNDPIPNSKKPIKEPDKPIPENFCK